MKIWLASRADGFFAYTKGVGDFLRRHGVDANKIFTLYNTIDIEEQRQHFERLICQREKLRAALHLHGKKILLFVGRLNKRKSLDFLTETLVLLRQKNPAYHLMIIGGGEAALISAMQARCGADAISYHGVVPERDIGKFYISSDVYVFPGAVGLGPLHALCCDLTPAVIDSPIHNPEYEYLNEANALILPRHTPPQDFAVAIDQHLENQMRWQCLRAQAWPSIKHLTIENMANNFINGINTILLG
jgi:glycosyltransferase involved in cell wall biosynthesis